MNVCVSRILDFRAGYICVVIGVRGILYLENILHIDVKT